MLKSCVGLGLLAVCTIFSACTATAVAQSNVIVILTDDQRQDEWQYMPNVMQHIAATGATLPNFFVSTASCCPSRATILRGQYAHNTGVRRNNPIDGGWKTFNQNAEGSTIATWLQAAGYQNGLFGKYLNGYGNPDKTYVPPGWNEWHGTFTSNYYDYEMNNNGLVSLYGSAEVDYQPAVVGEKAKAWIGQKIASNQPFFAYISANVPHNAAEDDDIGHPPPLYLSKYESLFGTEIAPRSPSFNEADISDKPQYVANNPLMTQADIDATDELRRARLRALKAIDDLIPELITVLDAGGQLANTYIIVTSDHGYLLGEHRVDGKSNPYQEAIKIGAFVRGPGIPAGSMMTMISGNIDLAPTIAKMAQVVHPSFVDGRPLLSSLKQTAVLGRKALLIEHWKKNSLPADFWMAGYHTGTYKFVEHNSGEREYYDLVADPYELNNLASGINTDAYSAFLASLKVCTGIGCLHLENNPPMGIQ